MRKYRVVYSSQARRQIDKISDRIFQTTGYWAVSDRYIDRLLSYCEGLSYFPYRGRKIDHISAGYRIIGFDKRTNIIFRIDEDLVTIMYVFYGGQDYESHLAG